MSTVIIDRIIILTPGLFLADRCKGLPMVSLNVKLPAGFELLTKFTPHGVSTSYAYFMLYFSFDKNLSFTFVELILSFLLH